jgi:hypothetical protein
LSHVGVSVHAGYIACTQASLSTIHQVAREIVVAVATDEIAIIAVHVVPNIIVVELSGIHVRIVNQNVTVANVDIVVIVIVVYNWIA